MQKPAEQASSNWWRRPCGAADVLQIALPLVLSSLSWTLLTFIDRIFLTWWSTTALAASFPAALLWWTTLCFPLGVCMYVATFVSQYHGAQQKKQVGPVVWQGVWIAVFATPLIGLVVPLAPWLFALAGHGEQVVRDEVAYFRVLSVGSVAMLISYALSSFYSGQGRTWVVMVIDAIAALVNIVLDWAWIFGYGGFPALGITGAAWATSVALWLKVAIYLAILFSRTNRLTFAAHQFGLQRRLLGRLLYYGGPSGLQMFLEVCGFTVFVFLVGRLGEIELAATNLAFNVSTLAFMPVFGLSTTAAIMVGQQLGQDRPDLAARATWVVNGLAMGYMGFVSTLYVVVPDLFLFGFFAHQTAESSGQIRALAIVLLRYVAAYNLFDAMNLVFANAIKGAGDTHFVFGVSLLMAIVLTVSTWVGVTQWDFGLHACWTLITAWVTLLGCIYVARFLQGKWRGMRVIE